MVDYCELLMFDRGYREVVVGLTLVLDRQWNDDEYQVDDERVDSEKVQGAVFSLFTLFCLLWVFFLCCSEALGFRLQTE